MNYKKIILILIINLILFSSCDFFKTLPKPENIPFDKSDYNGFYKLGENGKPFKLKTNDSLVYNVIKQDFIGLNKIKFARVQFEDYGNKPMIYIELTKVGRLEFKKLTQQNIHNQLAVIFNNTLFMCPTIVSEIPNGNVSITSDLNLQETVNIVAYINLNTNN